MAILDEPELLEDTNGRNFLKIPMDGMSQNFFKIPVPLQEPGLLQDTKYVANGSLEHTLLYGKELLECACLRRTQLFVALDMKRVHSIYADDILRTGWFEQGSIILKQSASDAIKARAAFVKRKRHVAMSKDVVVSLTIDLTQWQSLWDTWDIEYVRHHRVCSTPGYRVHKDMRTGPREIIESFKLLEIFTTTCSHDGHAPTTVTTTCSHDAPTTRSHGP